MMDITGSLFRHPTNVSPKNENTHKSRLGGEGRGGASFSAPGFVFHFFLSSFFNFSFGSDPMKRSL